MKKTRSKKSCDTVPLKGPKHEKFVAGFFAQVRPVWIGELETRPKIPKINGLDLIFLSLLAKFFIAMSATALKNIFWLARWNSTLIDSKKNAKNVNTDIV